MTDNANNELEDYYYSPETKCFYCCNGLKYRCLRTSYKNDDSTMVLKCFILYWNDVFILFKNSCTSNCISSYTYLTLSFAWRKLHCAQIKLSNTNHRTTGALLCSICTHIHSYTHLFIWSSSFFIICNKLPRKLNCSELFDTILNYLNKRINACQMRGLKRLMFYWKLKKNNSEQFNFLVHCKHLS